MGVKLHPQDIKEELNFKHSVQEDLYGLTLDDIQNIINSLRYKHKVQFICQLSSLMRISELIQLRKKHLISNGENIIVKIPASIAKFKKGRTTFFSKEASKLLRPILREKQDNDLIFGSSENKINSKLNSEQILRKALIRIGQFAKKFAEYFEFDRITNESTCGRTERVWLNIDFKRPIQTKIRENDSIES